MNVENYISINYKLRDFPTIGATFITTSGLFVDLNERGYDFSAFVNDLRKQHFCFGMKTERIRALEMKGWIRCNDGTKDGNAYIELYRHTPTAEQKLALHKWLTNIQTSKKCLTISFAYDNKIHTATWYPSDQMFKKNYCALCNDLDNKILVTIGHGYDKLIMISENLKEKITKKALILEGKAYGAIYDE